VIARGDVPLGVTAQGNPSRAPASRPGLASLECGRDWPSSGECWKLNPTEVHPPRYFANERLRSSTCRVRRRTRLTRLKVFFLKKDSAFCCARVDGGESYEEAASPAAFSAPEEDNQCANYLALKSHGCGGLRKVEKPLAQSYARPEDSGLHELWRNVQCLGQFPARPAFAFLQDERALKRGM